MTKTVRNTAHETLNKVPEVTAAFWIIKILSTTVGETGADYLAVHVGWGSSVTSIVMSLLLGILLFFQICQNRYIPSIYWLTVVSVSVVGTQITDILTDKLEVSLYLSTAGFSIALALTFWSWYHSEKTLAMQSITTRKREMFYWLAILLTFALGTATGDMATESWGLGFKLGVGVFSILIAFTGVTYRLGLNPVLAFWITYILTRPLGASIGDLLSQSPEYGGVGFGTIWTSIIFLAVIVGMVSFLTVKEHQTFSVQNREY